MATKCFCDRCGKPDAMRVVSTVATSGNMFVDDGKKLDIDLCFTCATRAIDLVQKSFVEAMS